MRSLKSVLLGWFLFFSLVPLFVVTYALIHSFDLTYRRESELRLSALVQEIELRLESDQQLVRDAVEVWTGRKLFNLVTNSSLERRQVLAAELVKQRPVDGVAFYATDGRLLISYQKDEEGKWNLFPTVGGRQVFYLPKGQRDKMEGGEPHFALKTYPKRKVALVMYQRVTEARGQSYIVEATRNLSASDFDLLRSRRQADMLLMDANFRRLLSTWADAPSSPGFYASLVGEEGVQHSRQVAGTEVLIFPKLLKWGDSDLVLFSISPKQSWNEAMGEIQFYVLIVLILLTGVLIVATVSVTSNIIEPLKSLVGITRKVLYEKSDIRMEAGPYIEITSLAEAVAELSRDIRVAQSSLLEKIEQLQLTQAQLVQSEKLNSLGLLVAGIAHEINNPVGFIYSNLKPLRDYMKTLTKAVEKLPSEEQQKVQAILNDLPALIGSFEEGSLRIKKIVDGLRTFSRQSSDNLERLSVDSLIDSTLVLLSHELKTRAIEVNITGDKDLAIQGSPTELSQVLLNILMNACQAIRSKGLIKVATQKVMGAEGQDVILISIKDSGPGIAPEVQAHIFEPFFTTKPTGQGTGLGLSISYGIIQKHGGSIEVVSEVGEGAEFKLFLPLA